MEASKKYDVTDDLRIACKQWAIQSDVHKVNDIKSLEVIHQCIKGFMEKKNRERDNMDSATI